MHVKKRKGRKANPRMRSMSLTPMMTMSKKPRPTSDAQRVRRVKQLQQKRKFQWLSEQRVRRERWAKIAEETQRIVLGNGKYVEERILVSSSSLQVSMTLSPKGTPISSSETRQVEHDISAAIQLSRQGTTFYPHYSAFLAERHSRKRDLTPTKIEFDKTSVVAAAQRLILSSPHLQRESSSALTQSRLAILSAASPKRPGGGFLHGGDEPEEVLARLSSLVASLSSEQASPFYREHRKFLVEDGSGLHDHSMVYSPGVVLFRRDDDDGEVGKGSPSTLPPSSNFMAPCSVNVISAVPVNAAAVRRKHLIIPAEADLFESGIRTAMRERMARALYLAEQRGDKALILGPFGCGSSENHVEVIAECWAELLVCPEQRPDGLEEARFKGVFDTIVFAVPGKLHDPFKKAFDMRVFEAEVAVAASGGSGL